MPRNNYYSRKTWAELAGKHGDAWVQERAKASLASVIRWRKEFNVSPFTPDGIKQNSAPTKPRKKPSEPSTKTNNTKLPLNVELEIHGPESNDIKTLGTYVAPQGLTITKFADYLASLLEVQINGRYRTGLRWEQNNLSNGNTFPIYIGEWNREIIKQLHNLETFKPNKCNSIITDSDMRKLKRAVTEKHNKKQNSFTVQAKLVDTNGEPINIESEPCFISIKALY